MDFGNQRFLIVDFLLKIDTIFLDFLVPHFHGAFPLVHDSLNLLLLTVNEFHVVSLLLLEVDLIHKLSCLLGPAFD